MDLANGTSQGQDVSSSSPGIGTSQTSSAQAPSSQPAPQSSEASERTFRQQEVNDIVRRAKQDVHESYRRNTDAQYRQDSQFANREQQAPSTAQPQYGDERIKQYAADAAKQYVEQVRQDALRSSQEEAAQRTVQNFWSKVLPGREKYQDFDSVAGDIDFQMFPNVVQLLGDHLDNSADVLYYLGNDRFKLNELENLISRSPKDGVKAAKRLAETLKDNEAASKVRLPNEPISQLRPSNTGTDNGAMSVSDYRKKYKV